ncbi:uncharacterized protein LOC112127868 [Cimex lectularius]|uniref:Transposase n=1 Tax=Cimex lectularius TaxID=79782 RepID=A0A8I6SMP7_CIMLE|nr:uncharacterized protein LOC112127868 [Cimex lectularius]
MSESEVENCFGDWSDSNQSLQLRTTGMSLNLGTTDTVRREGDPLPEITTSATASLHVLTILDGKFFEIILDKSNENNVVAKCKKCDPDLRSEVKGHRLSSSNYVYHLKRKHGQEGYNEYREYLQEKKYKYSDGEGDCSNGGYESGRSKGFVKHVKICQPVFEEKITRFLIHSMIPFRVVENECFADLLKSIGILGLKIPSRKNVVRKAEVLFKNNNDNLRVSLKDVNFVCTSADIWSGKKRSFIGVTVHWINAKYTRQSAALACRRFKNSHTYDRIATLLEEIHLEFGLSAHKIVATVTDNGANFVKAFKLFGVDKKAILTTCDGDIFPDDLHVAVEGQCAPVDLSSESDADFNITEEEENFTKIFFSAKYFSEEIDVHFH